LLTANTVCPYQTGHYIYLQQNFLLLTVIGTPCIQ